MIPINLAPEQAGLGGGADGWAGVWYLHGQPPPLLRGPGRVTGRPGRPAGALLLA